MPVKCILNAFLLIVTILISFSVRSLNCCTTRTAIICDNYDDWVSNPEEGLCHGHYVEALPPFPGACPEFLAEQPTTITSHQGEFVETGPTTLLGNVRLIEKNTVLSADKATIFRNSQTGKIDIVRACGNVRVLEPGVRLEGSEGEAQLSNDVITIENASFRFYQRHARGTARRITSRNKTYFVLDKATYTTCAPGQNTWELRAQRVSLNKISGRGHARHATLHVKDFPIFYFPYVDFPIDDRRQTGFLYPIFGNTNQCGTELALPFYWNIAPNYDATFTPRFLSKRGVDLQGKFRYLVSNSTGEVRGSYLPYDRTYKSFLQQSRNAHPNIANNDPRVTALNKTSYARSQFFVSNSSVFNRNIFGKLHYHTVSDDNYFMDLGNTLQVASTNQLLQEAELRYQDTHWNHLLHVENYQTLHPFAGPQTSDPYRRLPQFASTAYYPDLSSGFEFDWGSEFCYFDHKADPMTNLNMTRGDRYQARPSLSLPMVYPGWFLKPRLQYDLLAEQLRLNPAAFYSHQPQNPGRAIPMLDIDSGLIFERPLCFAHENLTQTLEPRAYYLLVPFQNQNRFPIFDTSQPGFDINQLFRDNRFSGLDRMGDANQLTLAISSRLLNTCTGVERFILTIGQIQYFKNRRVTACDSDTDPNCIRAENPGFSRHQSPLVGLARYRIHDTLTANAGLEWDTNRNRDERRSFYLQYHPSDLNVINVGYQYLRHNPANVNPVTNVMFLNQNTTIEQTDASIAWTITEQWRVLGRWYYDIKQHRTNETLLGLEQQGCCTAVRFSWLRFLRPNAGQAQYTQGIFLQFIFKGFAGVGDTKLGPTLSRSIPGYMWHGSNF